MIRCWSILEILQCGHYPSIKPLSTQPIMDILILFKPQLSKNFTRVRTSFDRSIKNFFNAVPVETSSWRNDTVRTRFMFSVTRHSRSDLRQWVDQATDRDFTGVNLVSEDNDDPDHPHHSDHPDDPDTLVTLMTMITMMTLMTLVTPMTPMT